MRTMETPLPGDADAIRADVRRAYAAVARGDDDGCCGPTTCSCSSDASASINMIGDAYAGVEGYVADADLGLGCGVPTEFAELAPGQTVLDLGSGAGVDAFVARRIVGEAGRVIGVDMTPEMITKARRNAAALGYDNVEFRLGEIEALPVEHDSVDVVISNCVLNLVPDKSRAFAEAYRALKPGGHLCVSDIVTRGDIPPALRRSAELYAGCVAGALDEADYLAGLQAAGFVDVDVRRRREIVIPDEAVAGVVPAAELAVLRSAGAGVWSVTVFGRKQIREKRG